MHMGYMKLHLLLFLVERILSMEGCGRDCISSWPLTDWGNWCEWYWERNQRLEPNCCWCSRSEVDWEKETPEEVKRYRNLAEIYTLCNQLSLVGREETKPFLPYPWPCYVLAFLSVYTFKRNLKEMRLGWQEKIIYNILHYLFGDAEQEVAWGTVEWVNGLTGKFPLFDIIIIASLTEFSTTGFKGGGSLM